MDEDVRERLKKQADGVSGILDKPPKIVNRVDTKSDGVAIFVCEKKHNTRGKKESKNVRCIECSKDTRLKGYYVGERFLEVEPVEKETEENNDNTPDETNTLKTEKPKKKKKRRTQKEIKAAEDKPNE